MCVFLYVTMKSIGPRVILSLEPFIQRLLRLYMICQEMFWMFFDNIFLRQEMILLKYQYKILHD
jgi:hypothetical protein